VARAAWFDFEEAKKKINQGQRGQIGEFRKMVSGKE
jgi:predicted NUDIX family NTP pyrophosphohydrolase